MSLSRKRPLSRYVNSPNRLSPMKKKKSEQKTDILSHKVELLRPIQAET